MMTESQLQALAGAIRSSADAELVAAIAAAERPEQA